MLEVFPRDILMVVVLSHRTQEDNTKKNNALSETHRQLFLKTKIRALSGDPEPK